MTALVSFAFLPGSPGPLELLIVFIVVLVLFGPRRLPEIARMIGRTLHELRRASDEFRDQIMQIEDGVPDAAPEAPGGRTEAAAFPDAGDGEDDTFDEDDTGSEDASPPDDGEGRELAG